MKQHLFAVYGASGFGREVMPLARDQVRRAGGSIDSLVFIEDKPVEKKINGQRVIRFADYIHEAEQGSMIALAIAGSPIREKLALQCGDYGFSPWSVRAANVVVLDQVIIGEGAILSPFVTLTANVRIGKHFHANLYSYVGHDCVIGDYVTFAPGVKCNGNVVIEDHAYVGTGAILKQGRPGKPLIIGAGAVVGMGAVVTKSVEPGAVVVGNPARLMEK